MPPDRVTDARVVTLGAWTLAVAAWAVALQLLPGVPQTMREATLLAALYALGRS